MHKTLELLKTNKCFENYEILDFKQHKDFYYLKVKAILINKTQLFVREYVSTKEYLYSYHWQDSNQKLIIRWDNAPHYRQHKTYPHHKHTPELEESEEVNLEDVLKVINKRILKENQC